MQARRLRIPLLTCGALLGFAANSLLCRAALGAGRIDAASFTTLRLGSGALALALLLRLRNGGRRGGSGVGNGAGRSGEGTGGSFGSAAALFVYAIAFSIAYLRIGAAVGALVLFGSVQATMIGSAIVRGERPTPLEWLGLMTAAAGLVALTFPGLHAPDAVGVALMAGAGVAWGVYSLKGRRATAPLVATAGNFARSVPFALGASAVALLFSSFHVSPRGALLAVASGAVASGLCYSLWYAALAGLSSTRAAVVQLCVPVLAGVGAVLFLGEEPTLRLLVAGSAILGGVALAVLGRKVPR